MFRIPMHKRIGTLAAAALIAPAALAAATAPAHAATRQITDNQQITVNLGPNTSPVYHGASGAVIAGPNTAVYYSDLFSQFLSYAKANNVLPDIITWHELSPSSISNFPNNLASLHSIESSLGIGNLPVNIDEYADQRDLS